MDELIRKRGTVKGQITKAETWLRAQFEESIGRVRPSLIQVRLDLLQKNFNTWEELQNELESSAHNDRRYQEFCTQREEMEEVYVEIKAGMLDLLHLTTTPTSNQSEPMLAQTTSSTTSERTVKLPTLNLPTFSGNYKDWASFHDIFTALVDQCSTLTNAQKLHYLVSSLQGEAARLLNTMAITDANYQVAWDALKRRFDNKKLTIHAHLKAMLSQNTVTSESAPAIRKLIDTTEEHKRALEGMNALTVDTILAYLVCEKLDVKTRREWEIHTGNKLENLDKLREFLEIRCQALEAIAKPHTEENKESVKFRQRSSHHVSSTTSSCVVCKQSHALFQCPSFIQMTARDRSKVASEHRLCFNCLRSNHITKTCKSSTCKKCGRKHNTMLHFEGNEFEPSQANSGVNLVNHNDPQVSFFTSRDVKPQAVLLMTALVNVRATNGLLIRCRALLDNASQISFISENCVDRLGLKRVHSNIEVTGVGGGGMTKTHGIVHCELSSCYSNSLCVKGNMHVLPVVTGFQPTCKISLSLKGTNLEGLQLADPLFSNPGPIDILIGADLINFIMKDGLLRSNVCDLTAYNTIFGHVLCGPVTQETSLQVASHHVYCENELTQTLQRFWELEEPPKALLLNPEDTLCEKFYETTNRRLDNGSYLVRLPFKSDSAQLGDSFQTALKRFQRLERQLQAEPETKILYCDFMREYIQLKHMEEIDIEEVNSTASSDQYFMPHHGIFKENSETTKLRVVFDASAKSTSGVSLNDKLLTGPKLHQNLVDILIRFRTHNIALVADIAKMYRMIIVHPDDRPFQRIVWRENPSEELKCYQLNTVTYGTAAAPYLAIKTLNQTIHDEATYFPTVADKSRDFYVDDLISGTTDVSSALDVKRNLTDMLSRGGFQLRKWATNSEEVLEDIPVEQRSTQTVSGLAVNEAISTLGIRWHPATDTFGIVIPEEDLRAFNKRTLASKIAKLFDPLGFFAPVIIRAKILLQKLWILGLRWDDPLPENIVQNWNSFIENLSMLKDIQIPRKLYDTTSYHSELLNDLEVHGFCDSSETAYAAVVYIRYTNERGATLCRLALAKSKVAPIKQVTLPRLELCAAVLLTRLLKYIHSVLNIAISNMRAWSDSCVVLAWLQEVPRKWNTFVGNRVAEVQDTLSPSQWGYVKSAENPADCASRGITSSDLLNHHLWWNGPCWLSAGEGPPYQTPQSAGQAVPEERNQKSTCLQSNVREFDLVRRFSSLRTLLNVTAYLLRFRSNCCLPSNQRIYGTISAVEYQRALKTWIRVVQEECFGSSTDMTKLKQLRDLNPYRDDDQLLRVGGRIRHSSVSTDSKHPFILPKSHPFVDLLVNYHHHRDLHAGTQALLATLRQRFWIIAARNAVKKCIRACVSCAKFKPKTMQQIMGDLPSVRVTQCRPFFNVGVDYGGPLYIRSSKLRKSVTQKVYICLFVCMSTKAVHIELVSDLSAEAFIASLKRFVSRRGLCNTIFSDNGTTFVGANNELRRLFRQTIHDPRFQGYLATQGITWNFIPPSAPHFGGIWEAGIKSVKAHLLKAVGNAKLTYEEMFTLLNQVEACLNSRPLCVLENDPSSLEVLTPGHFLIGSPLNSIPELNVLDTGDNRLNRWQLVQKLHQHFWRRWQSEYLTSLQKRHKWKSAHTNVEVDDIVLVKEDNVPPLKWPLCRVTRIFKGRDDRVRVVELTSNGKSFKRPVVKLCFLPVNSK